MHFLPPLSLKPQKFNKYLNEVPSVTTAKASFFLYVVYFFPSLPLCFSKSNLSYSSVLLEGRECLGALRAQSPEPELCGATADPSALFSAPTFMISDAASSPHDAFLLIEFACRPWWWTAIKIDECIVRSHLFVWTRGSYFCTSQPRNWETC